MGKRGRFFDPNAMHDLFTVAFTELSHVRLTHLTWSWPPVKHRNYVFMLLCFILHYTTTGQNSLTPGRGRLPPESLSLCAQPSGLTGFLSPQRGGSLHYTAEAGHGEHKELCGREGERQHKIREFSWSGSKNLLELHIPSLTSTASRPLHNQWVTDQSSRHTWWLSF